MQNFMQNLVQNLDFDGLTSRDPEPVFWTPERLGRPSAWWGHVPFAFWLVANSEPRLFVELGTHYGVSYAAFCEAVLRLRLATRCYAVDTWAGDPHAGAYDDDVYAELRDFHDRRYASFSQLVRRTFDEACGDFADGSIDLLHIDGYHTYDAVRHDFDAWRSKLSDRAVVLFHDTNERERDFGVWRLLEELKREAPTFEFLHEHGLGMVAVGAKAPAAIQRLCALTDAAQIAAVRERFSFLGARWISTWEKSDLNARARGLEEAIAQKNTSARALEEAIAQKNTSARALEEALAQRDARVGLLEDEIRQKGSQIIDLEKILSDRQTQIEAARQLADKAAAETEGLRQTLARQSAATEAAQRQLADTIALLDAQHARIHRLKQASEAARQRMFKARDEVGPPRRGHRKLLGSRSWRLFRPLRRPFERRPHAMRLGHEMHSQLQLLDRAWYIETNPDVATAGFDPLSHFICFGCAEGRKPNPFFDPAWYLRRYPDVAAAGINPVYHFMQNGAAEGRDPSPTFQTRWYLEHNEDVAASGMNPLAHYLLFGQKEGREANSYRVGYSACKPATATAIECRKKPVLRREVALFVTHSPNGGLKPHVRHYLESLAREGIGITLIVAADRGFAGDEPWLYDLVDGLYVRANEGWDFACWAHVLLLNRHLYCADILYWLNDSLIGPVNQEALHALLERMRDNPAALVGLTANHQCGWHLQSYFLAIKRQALESLAFQEFVLDVECLPTKDDVINCYEIRFSRELEEANIVTAALFEPNLLRNPTLFNWKQLLEQGFAFLKVLVITNDFPSIDNADWREELQRRGYDVALADRLLTELPSPQTRCTTPSRDLLPSELLRLRDPSWIQPSDRLEFIALSLIEPRGRIAVVAHVYYQDLWPEISDALDSIDEPFDLFVTLVAGVSDGIAQAIMQSWSFAHVLIVDNHGRDILPFLSIARTGILFRYELVCKLHTKRSPWHEAGEIWRQDLIKGALGNRDVVRSILRAFRKDPDLGLVVADGQVFSGRELWTGNAKHLLRLFQYFGMNESEFDKSFAGGSIFWVRSCVLRTVSDLPLAFDDFEPEPIGNDGSLAHAVERLMSLVCYELGMVIRETSAVLSVSQSREEELELPELLAQVADTDGEPLPQRLISQTQQMRQLREQLTQVLAFQQARMETAQRAARARREHERLRAALVAAARGQASCEEARMQAEAELMSMRSERTELLSSTPLRATRALRLSSKIPREVRRVLRDGVKFAWWAATLPLPSKLRERRSILPVQTDLAAQTGTAQQPLTLPASNRTDSKVAEPLAALTVEEAVRRRFSSLEPLRTCPDLRSGRRISIVTDSIAPGLLYGGVATAIGLATALAHRIGADLRLVTRHQEADPEHLGPVVAAFGIPSKGDVRCVFAPPGAGSIVSVFDGDIFLTTSWWSTQATLRTVDSRRIIYLLQEDERMFYPQGDERLRCAETLSSGDIRFVVNSELLFRHFTQGSEALPNIAREGTWFEPAFPLTHYYDDEPARQRRSKCVKNFLFYARPNNLRNLYWRGLEAITASIEDGILLPREWNFIFVGRDLEPIELPRGVRPIILQNLQWHGYAALIRQIDVGLALIDTPHPSYPPLDLAASGAVAVTNRCGRKTSLSGYSDNILCVDPTVAGLKRGIADAIVIASDDDLRSANYARAGIVRDWNDAFEPVLHKCVEWIG